MRIQAPTGVSLKDRRELTMTDFRGVDFSSSPLRVSLNRATDAANFINEYGVNRKRHGWDQRIRILKNGKPQRINGIFEYYEGEQQVLLIHAGIRFYRAVLTDGRYEVTDITANSTYAPAKVDTERLKDTRSQVFLQRGRAYIIGCGDFLVYGSWDGGETYELRRVADNEDTYIPTTCISIDCDAVTDDDVRAVLDDVNMLSSYRINRLLGRNGTSNTWTLDAGSIDRNSLVSITLETVESGVLKEHLIMNSGEDKTILYRDGVSVGSVNFDRGKITLSIDTTPPIENMDNIFVTFRHSVEGYSDIITNCQFGTLFGIGGNTDRLFLSGNAAHPNIDFHSEMDDYTYFSDLATSAMGSDAAPVGGYARLSDSTLVIFKEHADQEASIYYRTGRYDSYTDEDGSIDELQAVFPTTAGSIGESLLSRHACVNLAGDCLMLSRNGVFGVLLSDNVATTERYTRERSRSINERLLAHEKLENAVGVVFEGRYYLSVDGVCYVADSRYKYVREDDVDGSFNYEWWYFENVPARVWMVMDGHLYFGTEDGRICVFDDKYTDRTHYVTEEGDVGVNITTGRFTFREGLEKEFSEEDTVTVESDGLFSLYLRLAQVKDDRIYVSPEEILTLYDGTEVFADNVGMSGLTVGVRYAVENVDRGLCCFSLSDETGKTVKLTAGGFNLYRPAKGRELRILGIGDSFFTLKERYGADISFSAYDGTVPTSVTVRFTHRKNVVARWCTPVLDLGTNTYAKTLLSMTVSTDASTNGKLSIGYETRTVSRLISAKGVHSFSFEDLSFEDFTFEGAFASSYTRRVNARNFNYIMFRFLSDNDCDCAVNSFTARYKINKANKGVR